MKDREITVQELIDLLEKLPDKSLPIDICRQGCYGGSPERHRIVPNIREHRSDVRKEVRAYSIEALRHSKFGIDCDIVDGYEPLTPEDCAKYLAQFDDEGKEIVLEAINLRRKNNQKFANLAAMREKETQEA